jgi:hypothetical protein
MNGTKQVSHRWRAVALVAIGVAFGSTLTATPVYSHVGGTVTHLWTKHIRPQADKRYHTKAAADVRYARADHAHDGRYYGAGAKVADSDMLDALDSTAFLRATAKAAAAELLDGSDSSAFLRNGAAAGGDLTGTYPAPTLAPNSVGTAEVVNNTLGAADVFRGVGTVTVDLPSIPANTCNTQNVTISGRTPGDYVVLFPSVNFGSVGVVVQPIRSISMSGESHIFGVCNISGAAVDPPSGSWGYLLTRP